MYGTKISIIRLARGYTQSHVATQLGISQNAYSKIEKDLKIRMDEDCLTKIATILGVSIEDIKSPLPVIMNFQQENKPDIFYDKLLTELTDQLKRKDYQIEQLLSLINGKALVT